jgi:oligopeptide/dipeptide ABC transporter ATP-binding protein
MLPLLQVEHVSKIFSAGFFNNRRQAAVDDVSLILPDGEACTIALAGESGSGKTTLAQMIQGFLPPTQGQIAFQGQDVYAQNKLWTNHTPYFQLVQTIFQNPFETFNPFYPIDHVFDLTISHYRLAGSKAEAKRLVEEILQAVHLDPSEILGRYQHQLSGGQLQRLMIARALLLKPKLLIADEPVSMVDVSLRAMILDLMVGLKKEYGISIIYITHDLSTALQIADEILIMYQGSLVEAGDAQSVIQRPAHPYTQLLVQSIPLPDPGQKWSQPLKTEDIWNRGIALEESVKSCKFYPRCPKRMDICLHERPHLVAVQENQQAACFLYPEKLS